MPKRLVRLHGGGDSHFITCSCYQRRQFMGSARRRDLFLTILEEVRQEYDIIMVGYVVMPEHFHILTSEPKAGNLSVAMQVLKQRVSRKCRKPPESDPHLLSFPVFWLPRYYDFNVYSHEKVEEKLQYIHHNPVKRGLVESPEQWQWSSYRFYQFGELGPVKIGE